ncbi:glutamate-5-semialdehyde dehydrogenase [Bartonella sp. AR 15-3]|nr:glutamate-5-semialdehyde dehydrogenase [Bartonella sp. AR 15-3]
MIEDIISFMQGDRLACEEDGSCEYLDAILSVKMADGIEGAIVYI